VHRRRLVRSRVAGITFRWSSDCLHPLALSMTSRPARFIDGGTTALAALKLGFQLVGIERNEEYARLAEERIADFSAKLSR
jgi:hypothetical protein